MNLVHTYDVAEREALARLSNRAIQAFGAITFAAVGYPFRVHDERELWRYIDVMQELRFESHLRTLKEVSDEEIQLSAWLAEGTYEYGKARFERRITGRDCATRALIQLRAIRSHTEKCVDNRVLELGPGSGQLSLLMAKSGYAVDTVEIAQAFALHQSLVFQHFFPKNSQVFPRAVELSPDLPPSEGAIRQIPWWVYASNSKIAFSYSLITANHAIAEFHPGALSYLLERYGPIHYHQFGFSPLIVADSLGSGRTVREVLQQFHSQGWVSDVADSVYCFRFDPPLAREQLTQDLQASRYEKSLKRAVKRTAYLLIHERATRRKKTREVPETSEEHDSITRLRQVFDSIATDEDCIDARYMRQG